MSAASRSEKSSAEGRLPVRSAAKRRSRRKVSRYDATVFGLAPRWAIRRSVRNASSVGGESGHSSTPAGPSSRRPATSSTSSGDELKYQ